MEINEYQKLAMKTVNPDIPQKGLIVNAVMGLSGEVGEVADILKKHMFQGHDLNKEKLIDELGDVAWYIAEAATALGVELDEIYQKNIDKLAKRYPNGFEASKSINR